jgi:ABC-type amino acid transport substrate-binding protein
VIRGYAYPKEFLDSNSFAKDEANDIYQSLRKLSLGRVDLALAESDSGDYLLRGSDLKGTAYKNHSYLDAGVWNFLAFGKNSPNGKKLAKLYDDIIPKMIEDGTYQRIYERYLGRAPEKLPEPVLQSDK